ncbi:MAG TPA: M17 family peptidase N-terminal domain-containing protein [Pseudonocardia sp.]
MSIQAIVVPSGFDSAPSVAEIGSVALAASAAVPDDADAVGVLVGPDGPFADVGFDRAALAGAGFAAGVGSTLVLPAKAGPPRVLIGVGDAATLDVAGLRDAAASFANAADWSVRPVLDLSAVTGVAPGPAAQAVVEGILLARYRFTLRTAPRPPQLTSIAVVVSADVAADALAGAERGKVLAGATALARDLANCPPAHLTATRMADLAVTLGAERGLQVEVFDRDALLELGCGGLLAVNGGSTEPPRMIKLTYQPAAAAPRRIALVGKGIMYDSGGISLKPADPTHAMMKNDMSGAAAVLAAMCSLRALECPTAVSGYLMCTDNMPSGSAVKMGDVLTVRGGTTVEVQNTDAEGRLVMADALVLAAEEQPDVIVDIATLTGAMMRALGTSLGGVIGNDQAVVDRLVDAGAQVDEPLWQLPLERRYRADIDAKIADIQNLGGPNAGAITAALFLNEFVAGLPWAHVDIAGVADVDKPGSWRPAGCSGFGARLLAEFAVGSS